MSVSERVFNFVDKRDWGEGPWQAEPDKVQWVDPGTGLDCLAVRHSSLGHWCGYIGVSEGHPLFGVAYTECPVGCGEDWCEHRAESVLDVHGGITYSDFCQEGAGETGICHLPFPGRAERVWWLGWDCAHADDLCPYMEVSSQRLGLGSAVYRRGEVYRDLAYVRAECSRLAAQLATMGAGG